MSKKYKLFSASGDGRAKCAFYASPAGCRNGENCKFSHETANDSNTPRKSSINECSSVISSESEGEGAGAIAPPSTPAGNRKSKDALTNTEKCMTSSTEAKTSNKKRKNRRGESDIFVKPKGDLPSPPPSKKAKLMKSANSASPKSSKEPKKSNLNLTSMTQSQPKKQNVSATKKTKVRNQKQPCSDFRNLDLPISSFSVLEKGNPPKKAAVKEGSQTTKVSDEADSSEEEISSFPLPTSSETGRKWKDTVVKTRAHKSYSTCYDFDKWKAQDAANGIGSASEWIKARPYGEWCKNNPQAIAIDCEMCETKDPVTGKLNHKALCRVSVVNAENPEETLLDTLVKPEWPVTNYRTWVNGIKKEDLDNVQFTLRHAQAFMMALCSEETVIIGQSLENDLCAIRMEHHCNADSANIFVAKDDNNATPGLKDIAKAVLKEDMPETHDSVNDAKTALRCLEYYIERDGKVEPIPRTAHVRKNKLAASQLFVHRIPKICTKDHLESLFLKHTWISPLKIDDIESTGPSGKTVVTFKSTWHANLAFLTLEGDQDFDASGRAQKKIYLRSGGYIRVRKMVHDKKKNEDDAKEGESEN
mmetsp:Transcript_10605/g.16248  ORF Transcript_10605/g.16248 Transcript_10605/m.16248 type:complete len:589 (-) Transcript_10605:132-1898(-)